MTELEQALVRLGADVAFPETPDIAASVRRRLGERPPRRAFRLPERRTLAVAFALLVLAAGVAMAVPPARAAILEFFHLRGATVQRVETLPRVPDRIAAALELGKSVSLDEATRRAQFEVLVPEDLGDPDGVYYSSLVGGGKVSLVYAPRDDLPRSRFTRVGALVTEFRADINPSYVHKLADQVTKIQRLMIDGEPAIWMEGGPHVVIFDTQFGPDEDEARLAGNTLLFEHGDLLVRIEGNMSRERAVAIAESLR